MKFVSKLFDTIDKDGSILHHIHCDCIEEPGDLEKDIEDSRDMGAFLRQHGHPGNKWERRAVALQERLEERK